MGLTNLYAQDAVNFFLLFLLEMYKKLILKFEKPVDPLNKKPEWGDTIIFIYLFSKFFVSIFTKSFQKYNYLSNSVAMI